jgi:O-methyltransferase involved in polyketide biosynthesis
MDDTHHKITPTADLISYFRIFSDIPFAKEIADMTKAKAIAKEILKENFDNSSFLAVMAESRFKKINFCAKGFTNILEVAVGRSPRDLIFTEDPKISYIATDLPDSLKNHELIIKELIEKNKLQRKNLHFAAVNALNFEELEYSEKLLPKGEIAIISEGMIVYFTKDEKKRFLDNVHKILEKRGGALITSDIVIISEQGRKSFNSGFKGIANTTGRDMRDLDFNSLEEAKEFISKCGFNVELFNPSIELVSMKKLNLKNNVQAQRVASLPVWVLKVK